MLKPAIFFDRDGTLIEDPGYLADPEAVRLLPGAAAAVRSCNDAGVLAVVVTNQSGVGRGYLTEETLAAIHDRLAAELAALSGARLDGIYYCPHHPEASVDRYRLVCGCRKPGTGLVERALEELPVDPGQSYLVGDSVSDMQLALNLGIPGVLVTGDRPPPEVLPPGAAVTARGPEEATEWVLNRLRDRKTED